jgi:hypothetical protein
MRCGDRSHPVAEGIAGRARGVERIAGVEPLQTLRVVGLGEVETPGAGEFMVGYAQLRDRTTLDATLRTTQAHAAIERQRLGQAQDGHKVYLQSPNGRRGFWLGGWWRAWELDGRRQV